MLPTHHPHQHHLYKIKRWWCDAFLLPTQLTVLITRFRTHKLQFTASFRYRKYFVKQVENVDIMIIEQLAHDLDIFLTVLYFLWFAKAHIH